MLNAESLVVWRELAGSITTLLTKSNLTWYHVTRPVLLEGPTHWGWSRMVTESYKARCYGKLLRASKQPKERNWNERGWHLKGLTCYNPTRWDAVYRNQSRLRCNLRIKYEEWRIIWGRQELNRYKDKYAPLKGGNSTRCSYCRVEIEDELHLYVECGILGEFWLTAKTWFMNNFGVVPILTLRAVPNGYPNPTRYPVFFSIPDPTRFSFENHRVYFGYYPIFRVFRLGISGITPRQSWVLVGGKLFVNFCNVRKKP